jgi:hypothetical protein
MPPSDDRLRTVDRRTLLGAGSGAVATGLGGCAGDRSTADRTVDTTAATTTGVENGPAQTRPADATADHQRIWISPDDDLAGILTAVEAGATVILEQGRHEVEETISPTVDHVTLRGQGPLNTTVANVGDGRLLEFLGTPDSRDTRIRTWTIQNLAFHAGSGSANMIHAEYTDGFRLENVMFGGWQHTGNSLFAKGCWDWRFLHGRFASGGDPEEGTADVYATAGEGPNGGPLQTTNNFRFVSCHWERLASHGLYLDDAGGFRLGSCKFHGQPGEHPPVYHIDGNYRLLHVSNTRFGVANTGFVRARPPSDADFPGKTGVLLSNNFFHSWKQGGDDAPGIDLAGPSKVGVVNNSFDGGAGNKAPAVRVDADMATVTGNLAYVGGLHVAGGTASVTGNQLRKPPRDGIVVDADDASVTGNGVAGASRNGIRCSAVTGGSLGNNVVRGPGASGITAPDADGLAVVGNTVVNAGGEPLRIGGDSSAVGQNVTLERASQGQQYSAPAGGHPIPRVESTVDGDPAEVQDHEAITVPADGGSVSDPTVSADVWLTWADDALHLTAVVEDATHAQPETGKSTWKGDSIQFGVAPGAPGDSPTFASHAIALTEQGEQVYRITQPTGTDARRLHGADAVVQRDGETTTYEVAIPWSALPVSPDATGFGASLLINDNDGDGRRGYVHWGGGIGSKKDTAEFNLVELVS